MSKALDEADRRLAVAMDAAMSIKSDELPEDVAADVREAVFAIVAAKGHCEVER